MYEVEGRHVRLGFRHETFWPIGKQQVDLGKNTFITEFSFLFRSWPLEPKLR